MRSTIFSDTQMAIAQSIPHNQRRSYTDNLLSQGKQFRQLISRMAFRLRRYFVIRKNRRVIQRFLLMATEAPDIPSSCKRYVILHCSSRSTTTTFYPTNRYFRSTNRKLHTVPLQNLNQKRPQVPTHASYSRVDSDSDMTRIYIAAEHVNSRTDSFILASVMH